MNNAPQPPERPRRAFLEPPPRQSFLKTREGLMITAFSVLLVISSSLLFVKYQRLQAKIEREAAEKAQAAEAAAKPVVSQEELLAKKQAELGTIWEGALADTKNGDPFVETAGYAKLIELLNVMSPEATAARATSYVDYAALVAQPDLWRGEFIRVPGLLGGLSAQKLDNPVNGVRDIWRGTIAQPDGVSETYVLDFIGDPPAGLEMRSTVVEVDGLLYRTVSYESRTHEKRTTPYLLVRSIRALKTESKSGDETRFWAFLMGIGAIIGYLLFRSAMRAQKRQNQPPTRLRAMLDERRHAQREEQP